MRRQGRIVSYLRAIVWTNSGLIASERHDLATCARRATRAGTTDHRRRGLATRAAHRAQSAVRRQRSAHRPRRPHLHRAGDRQPDQRAGSSAPERSRPSAPKGGDIIAPDDVAFDPSGNLYATEVMDGRVSVRDTDGRTRVLRDDVPSRQRHHRAPRPAVHRRVPRRRPAAGARPGRRRAAGAAGERAVAQCDGGRPGRPAVFPGDGRQRDLAQSIPTAASRNVVAGDLGVPDSVKFDADGFIVSTQVASGQVLRIDPRSGDQTVLAQLNPGLDNLHLRRRPVVRLELHRRDHRDPAPAARPAPRCPAG